MTSQPWPKPLVSTNWLSENLDNPEVKVIDSSTLLPPKPDFSIYDVVPALDDYKKGHIPGAQFIDIEHELSAPHARFHFMLPTAEVFARTMGRLGVSDDTMVVTYATTNHWWATRLWWTLKVFGHVNVAVLNGGFQKWQAEHKPIETGDAKPVTSVHYSLREPNTALIANKESVLHHLQGQSACLINALRREQHDGVGGIHYGRKGRIPRSINLPALEHVNGDNTFKSIEELKKIFADPLRNEEVIAYCGGGIAATSVALVLDMLGHKNVKVYDASLTEWAADETLPMDV
ncbi:MAG: sulfurtransferase [Proteobacteria bacterium]|nr:sulfurtransferase [Pseudomonadota bacterium]